MSSDAFPFSVTLLLFDLNPTGHHAGFIRHLIRYWDARRGQLVAVVSADFPTRHPAIAALAGQVPNVRLQPITDEENQRFDLYANPTHLKHTATQWRIMTSYARRERADHVLLMYLDALQVALISQTHPPCPVSGLLLRPTLHHAAFATHPPSLKDRLRQWRKKSLLRLVLRHPNLHALFAPDQFSIPSMASFNPRVQCRALPEPYEAHPATPGEAEALRASLGAEPGRLVLLLFGHLDGRKGIGQLAQALPQLPDATLARLGIWLVGPLDADQREHVTAMETLAATRPLRVWRHHEFVPDEKIQRYFEAADGILALYQHHVGTSAVLIRAAAAQKPSIASNYGWQGMLKQEVDFGLSLDASDPAAIAQALQRFVDNPNPGNLEQMREFARKNRADEFARVIYDTLFETV